jgi:hypothetical protein
MKKSIALLALAFGVTNAFAQDLTSKKGEPMLPEAEDMAVSVDATPFLNYMGNFFGKTANNTAPTFNFLTSNQTITVKKFKDAQTAYRASVRIGLQSNTEKAQVVDATQTFSTVSFPALVAMKEDKFKSSQTNVGLAVGMEMRRGKTRLQGYYGAEAGIALSSSSEKYTYGNTITPNTATPAVPVNTITTTDFGSNHTTDTYGNNARVTRFKSGMGFAFGVRAFVGAEYFILPKISLGGEFGMGLGWGMSGKSKTTIESEGTGTGGSAVGTQEVVGNKSSGLILDTDNNNSLFGPSGSLRLNFHF